MFGPLSRGRSSRLQILQAIYRSASISITGAHRTTPTNSLLALAGLQPPQIDLLDRLLSCPRLPLQSVNRPKTKQTYMTSTQSHEETMQGVITQEWIPPDIRKSLAEDSPTDRHNPLLNTARQAYLSTRTCDLWHQTPTGQALKETGRTPMANCELSWWRYFPRASITRLSRFLSGYFPARAYLARFHCLLEHQTSQCRFLCSEDETRDHLYAAPT